MQINREGENDRFHWLFNGQWRMMQPKQFLYWTCLEGISNKNPFYVHSVLSKQYILMVYSFAVSFYELRTCDKYEWDCQKNIQNLLIPLRNLVCHWFKATWDGRQVIRSLDMFAEMNTIYLKCGFNYYFL